MMHGSLPVKLRVLRAQQGLTLAEAAERIGIGRDTLSDLERGIRHPVLSTLAKIAEGYEVPVEDLLASEAVPALAGASPKAEAPATGPAVLLEKALNAARSEAEDAKNIFRAELLETGFPEEYFDALLWPLISRVIRQEREISRLRRSDVADEAGAAVEQATSEAQTVVERIEAEIREREGVLEEITRATEDAEERQE